MLASFATFDWKLAGSIAFGFAAGWAARAAISVNRNENGEHIWRDFLVNVLISGGMILIVLQVVRLFELDPLGAAGVAFFLAMGGVKLLSTMHDETVDWLKRKLTPTEIIMGERRQDAQKKISAARLAQKDEEEKDNGS